MIALLFTLVHAEAADIQSAYEAGIEAARTGDHASASDHFLEAISAGARDPAAYHGLGNARYRQGRFGPAIAAWRRAERLAPRNGDVRANLDRGRRESLDRLDSPVPHLGPFFWQASLAPRESAWGASVSLTIALGVTFLARLRRWKPGAWRALAGMLGIASALLGASTAADVFDAPSAVVAVPQVAARSALGPDGVDLFVLHEGAEVAVAERAREAVLVVLPDDRKGWVPDTALLSTDPAGALEGL